ncbi:MAG: glycosyltransferase family 4 protein [Pseudomonadota bacterium]
MHIAMYTPAWPGKKVANGITTATVNFVLGLQQLGHTVSVLTRNLEEPDAIAYALPKVRPWRLSEKIGFRLGLSNPFAKFAAEGVAAKLQQIHEETPIDAFIMEETRGAAGLVQEMVDIPVILALHGPFFLHKSVMPLDATGRDNKGRENAEGDAIDCCAATIAPSDFVLKSTLKYYNASPTFTAVVPNPIVGFESAVNSSSTTASGEPLNEKSNAMNRILFVGRFDTHKAGDIVLTAMDLLAQKNVNVGLDFIGPDPGVPGGENGAALRFADWMKRLQPITRERINYHGPLPRDAISGFRKSRPITLIASRFENYPYTLLEAMAAASPVIATDTGGIPEIIDHEKTGLLVPPGDAKALAGACERLIKNPELARQLGDAAREKIETDFSPKRVASDLVDFLGPVIADFQKTRTPQK